MVDPFMIRGVERLDSVHGARVRERILKFVPDPPDGLLTIGRRMTSAAFRVRNLLPDRFDAYARILHPVVGEGGAMIRWRALLAPEELAAVGTQSLVRVRDRLPVSATGLAPEPMIGHFDRETADRVARAITAEHGDTMAYFVFWSGIGGLDLEPGDDAIFRGPISSLGKFSRSLDGAHTWYFSPSICLPSYGSWWLATYTDATSTYLGGSQGLVDHLLQDSLLDALSASPYDLVDDWVAPHI